MVWWQVAVILGLLAPLAISTTSLKVAFRDWGIVHGVMVWLGTAVLTLPLMMLIMWLGHLIF